MMMMMMMMMVNAMLLLDISSYNYPFCIESTHHTASVTVQLMMSYLGWPFVMFGDGEICKCNPIAESDLAAYMLDCIDGP